MSKLSFHITLLFLLLVSACVSIPAKHLTVSQRGSFSAVQEAHDCDIYWYKHILRSNSAQKPELDSGGFSILTWNVFKGIKEGWKEDFENLIGSHDILSIQEARLTDDLRELLKKNHYNWDISIAFKFNGSETGVLTASRIAPEFTCTFRIKEPMFSLPKTVMVTVYPLSNTDKTLMVVNMHSVNFTFRTGSFNKQLQKVENMVSQHHGPVILSGDVNTWSSRRMAVLKDIAIRLDLKTVPFHEHDRTLVFGRAVDHIYYRELTLTGAEVIKVTSSDHNPILAAFRLEEPG
ncbi:MAG: endonuclease/exonuclease/phosphatase family protein [Nitrospiraceae bacterium]|nr:MAG: endonuclease/exonuclease/phosphatase family protein [Nitrospiraceae bacterium]